jgi:hypothetical protein
MKKSNKITEENFEAIMGSNIPMQNILGFIKKKFS